MLRVVVFVDCRCGFLAVSVLTLFVSLSFNKVAVLEITAPGNLPFLPWEEGMIDYHQASPTTKTHCVTYLRHIFNVLLFLIKHCCKLSHY